MATSSVDICNSALVKIGAERITALADANERARVCNQQYDIIRKQLLACHPWNFAKLRVSLALSVTVPAFKYTAQFPLPSDCLRVLEVDPNVEYKIEGRNLLCYETATNILYIKDVTDTTIFAADFENALACRLAKDICYTITQSTAQLQALGILAKEALYEARTSNAQEGTKEIADENDTWLNARF